MLHKFKGNRLQSTKQFVRRMFRKVGLDVKLATPYQRYNYEPKWIYRFMHFDRLLNEIKDIDGIIVECGVGAGRSLFEFLAILEAIDTPRHIYGFDTFEGLPVPVEKDGERVNNKSKRTNGNWMVHSQETVCANLVSSGLEGEYLNKIIFIEGEFSQSLPSYQFMFPIAFLHLDCDIYESYKTALESLYHLVVPGGIIAFDEYKDELWPGATVAIDEFFADKPEKIVKSPVADKYYTVKI